MGLFSVLSVEIPEHEASLPPPGTPHPSLPKALLPRFPTQVSRGEGFSLQLRGLQLLSQRWGHRAPGQSTRRVAGVHVGGLVPPLPTRQPGCDSSPAPGPPPFQIKMLSDRKRELEHRLSATLEENGLLQGTVEELQDRVLVLERQGHGKDLQVLAGGGAVLWGWARYKPGWKEGLGGQRHLRRQERGSPAGRVTVPGTGRVGWSGPAQRNASPPPGHPSVLFCAAGTPSVPFRLLRGRNLPRSRGSQRGPRLCARLSGSLLLLPRAVGSRWQEPRTCPLNLPTEHSQLPETTQADPFVSQIGLSLFLTQGNCFMAVFVLIWELPPGLSRIPKLTLNKRQPPKQDHHSWRPQK